MSRTTLPTITSTHRGTYSRRAIVLAALTVPLAACGDQASAPTAESEDSPASDGGSSAGSITVSDPWVKAAPEGMTAAFGTVVNGTDEDMTLVAATTAASSEVQLHETAADDSGGMSMKEKEGGFELPAGGELVLEPGGHHLMLMSLTDPLQPGAGVELVLQFDDGTEVPFTATVKDFAGANEEYAPDEDHSEHEGDDAHEGHGE